MTKRKKDQSVSSERMKRLVVGVTCAKAIAGSLKDENMGQSEKSLLSVVSQAIESFLLPKQAKKPSVFFQNKTVEPVDVESVPSAAFFLSSKYPNENFEIRYHTTNINDENVERRPVLDLSLLKQIKIDDKDDDLVKVKVDAGVTVGMLVKHIKKKKMSSKVKELFSVLPSNNQLSLVETVFDKRWERFRNVIKEIHVVDKNGNIQSKQLSDLEKQEKQEDIMTSVVLSLSSISKSFSTIGTNSIPNTSSKTITRWYEKKSTETPIPDSFFSNLEDGVRVRIFRKGRLNSIPNVVIIVEGNKEIGLSQDDWEETILDSPEKLWYRKAQVSEEASLGKLTMSRVLDHSKKHLWVDVLKMFEGRREQLLVSLEKDVTAENDNIRVSFEPGHSPDLCFDESQPVVLAPQVQKTTLGGIWTAPLPPKVLDATVIEGFKGDIFDGQREQMQQKRFQYATSSFDNMMNPALIVYPVDVEDITLAIRYATLDEFSDARKISNKSGYPFKVMGRSGGHQYCGVSCDNDALIISMDNFKKLEMRRVHREGVTGPDGKPHTVTREMHVGPCVNLRDFAEFNHSCGVTIPHGECPGVCIGGHAQSGGYGHIIRNFGLAIDYVYGFTIVLADGSILTVNRDSRDEKYKYLYWAVLGGSPGAFGIITNVIIHPILNSDYPHSTGYNCRIISSGLNYNYDEIVGAKELLAILEDFINRAKSNDHESEDNAIEEGLDLCVSISINNDNDANLPMNVVVAEFVCRDKGTDMKKTVAYKQMEKIIEKMNEATGRMKGVRVDVDFDGKKHYKLSHLNLGYTRTFPSVTIDGRENRRAYRKTSYGSKDKLEPGWSSAFAKLLNDIKETPNDVSCIVQVVVGGGAHTRFGEAKLNSIAHRNAQLSTIVFDLFRGEDNDSINAAETFRKRFEKDVVDKYQSAHPKVIPQWASHGDLDMNKKEVWEKYFDDPNTYYSLRQIKKEVDPNDVFHSRFTIRPADDSTKVNPDHAKIAEIRTVSAESFTSPPSDDVPITHIHIAPTDSSITQSSTMTRMVTNP